ncbi:hypothetical protein EYD45_09375 [Hyunsoonleella flava]|uniref:Uncharacterized protein n=1 Tax=Hyunsoonleella flava TaxID=2527939 RepID=A0A4Q9FG30_9FLAO|nr:hypothetical protein [Hyunsoonleella flava]TBN03216.1 hypothetical protein EYD45_09375 [Hyunsoonleella flava]
MLSSTREDYKEKYENRLSNHKKAYFENDVTSFLEQELSTYTKYLNSLTKIADYFKNKTTKDLRVNPAITAVISDLKKANKSVFNEIFTIEKTRVVTDRVELEKGYEDEMIQGFIPGKIEIDVTKLKNYITSANKIIAFIIEKQKKTKLLEEKKTYEDEVWFKVGVKLASGEMDKYYTIDSKGIMQLKNSYTAPRVAEELGDKKWQKDVLATLKNYSTESTNAHKNIFNSRDKMMKIINHCKEKGIPVIPHFTDRLPPE